MTTKNRRKEEQEAKTEVSGQNLVQPANSATVDKAEREESILPDNQCYIRIPKIEGVVSDYLDFVQFWRVESLGKMGLNLYFCSKLIVKCRLMRTKIQRLPHFLREATAKIVQSRGQSLLGFWRQYRFRHALPWRMWSTVFLQAL